MRQIGRFEWAFSRMIENMTELQGKLSHNKNDWTTLKEFFH